jgi:hypothetical protein
MRSDSHGAMGTALLRFCCRVAVRPALGGRSIEGMPMSLQSRLSALKERHATLETQIAEEDQRPRPDAETLGRLKREKLHVKEEMERLRSQEGASAQ